jgi:hypothetical protein
MSASEKLSIFVGYQLLLVGFILAAFWIFSRVAAYTSKIPQDLLAEHRNRMKVGLVILVSLYLATDLVDSFVHHSHSLELIRGILVILVFVNYMIRSGLTIRTPKAPDKLKQLAWLEMGFSFLAVMAFALILSSAWRYSS